MNGERDISTIIDSFIETQRNLSPNPFLATRVMASINVENRNQASLFPAWQGIAMAFSLIVGIAAGMQLGSLYTPDTIRNEDATVLFISDDKMEHFMFYQQKANE